jgi:hypothetical protein
VKNDGRQSGVVAPALTNLSLLYRELGELDIAERYGKEALAVEEALYPPNHPSIAITLDSLGQVAQKRGDRAKARALYERSIAIYEGSQRPDDPALADSLRHLGGLLLEEGETKESVRVYERALAVKRKTFGDRHPDLARIWHELARGRLALNDLSAALEALHTGVEIFRSTLPADSPQLAGGLFLLGDVLRRNGRPGEALPYLEEAQAIWRKRPPNGPRDLAELEAALAATRAALR